MLIGSCKYIIRTNDAFQIILPLGDYDSEVFHRHFFSNKIEISRCLNQPVIKSILPINKVIFRQYICYIKFITLDGQPQTILQTPAKKPTLKNKAYAKRDFTSNGRTEPNGLF